MKEDHALWIILLIKLDLIYVQCVLDRCMLSSLSTGLVRKSRKRTSMKVVLNL